MSLDQPLVSTVSHAWPVLLAAGVLVALLAGLAALIVRRTSGAILTAGIAALICTTYSGDTSWRFAAHRLGMTDRDERLVMFAAGEFALLACAVMARANKRATATDDHAGTPGVPGVLVWCITGAQIIPAYAESGIVGGTVRALFGPVAAALLWHLAMGLEIRVTKPDALSTGLPAQIGHELRERLLSHLGLATRNRTAEEITRDRAHARAVRLASRRHLGPWGRARLAAAVARTHATANGTRRHALLQDLAGRRTAQQLRTMDVASPWVLEPAAQPHPPTPLGVTGAQLRRMDPIDAVRTIADAHPGAGPDELASLATGYGVPVSAVQVRIALRPSAALARPQSQPMLTVQPRPLPGPVQPDPADFDEAATAALALAQPTAPQPRATEATAPRDNAAEASSAAAAPAVTGEALVLDLAPMLPPHPELCAPAPAVVQPQPPQVTPATATPLADAAAPARSRSHVAQLRSPDADAHVLEQAQALNARVLAATRARVSQRQLQRDLGIGQRRAQRIHAQLPTSLPTAPTTATAAQPPAPEASAR
ncbi:hypothetical protein ACFW91_25035 [Streptomyces asoensis]|uniref:hypothetical protein n=1 Tax=Streptomyces asoensis TaxID=249586 RepID=UPI0036C65C3F